MAKAEIMASGSNLDVDILPFIFSSYFSLTGKVI